MRSVVSALVENHAGVLSRISGLFARRGFNIESLAVGETDNPSVSRMTIVVEGDERVIEQVEKQLNKQIDVIKVRILPQEEVTRRELALVKVNATPQTRSQIMDIAMIMKANIVDISPSTLTLEIADRPERIKMLLGMIEPYGIVEMVRTGMIAMQKGGGVISIEHNRL